MELALTPELPSSRKRCELITLQLKKLYCAFEVTKLKNSKLKIERQSKSKKNKKKCQIKRKKNTAG